MGTPYKIQHTILLVQFIYPVGYSPLWVDNNSSFAELKITLYLDLCRSSLDPWWSTLDLHRSKQKFILLWMGYFITLKLFFKKKKLIFWRKICFEIFLWCQMFTKNISPLLDWTYIDPTQTHIGPCQTYIGPAKYQQQSYVGLTWTYIGPS